MIRNVVFDIGNVLAGFEWQEYFRSFGYSQEIYQRLSKATVKSSMWNERDRGEMEEEQLLAGFVNNDPGIEKEIRAVFANVKNMIKRYDYAIPWIKDLKKRGYGIYIISNFSQKAHQDCAEALDFLKEVDGAILSYQVKLIKPDPAIYQLLLKKYGLTARECVFIDDMQVNVEAAKKQGMKGIVFHAPQQAKEELDRLLG